MILCYHNIIDTIPDAFDQRAERMHVARFRSQMERLARHFHPVSLRRYLQNLQTGNVDPKAVVVTFDDGYRGVLEHAAPILYNLGIPGTLFVVTGHASAPRPFFFDQIEIAFRLSTKSGLCMGLLHEPQFALDTIDSRIQAMNSIKRNIRAMPEMNRRLYQHVLMDLLGVSEERCNEHAHGQEKYTVLGWNDLREMASHGWALGSHTRSHAPVAALGVRERNRELKGSLEDLRREIGLSIVPFAYPYGREEQVGARGSAAVRRAGYSCAVTTMNGVNDSSTDPFLLRRVSTSTRKRGAW